MSYLPVLKEPFVLAAMRVFGADLYVFLSSAIEWWICTGWLRRALDCHCNALDGPLVRRRTDSDGLCWTHPMANVWETISSRTLEVFLMICSTCKRCSMCLTGLDPTRFTFLNIRRYWLVMVHVCLAEQHPMTEVLSTGPRFLLMVYVRRQIS